MQLPETIKSIIEEKLSQVSSQKLSIACERLSTNYRSGNPSMKSEDDYLAYVTTRAPATFGAISHVLNKIINVAPDLKIENLLDIGAGPGTGLWAVQEIFNHLRYATLIEKEKGLVNFGKNFDFPFKTIWLEQDLEKEFEFETHDLVLMSYALNEISEKNIPRLLEQLWKATGKIFIIIEPGTPLGFQRILKARAQLISLGGTVLAPCPHQNQCPIQNSDWCHFAERIERTSLHRKMKNAQLNYEDEKFSYVVMSKEKFNVNGARIIRRPQKNSGFVQITTCSQNGIENKIISKSKKDNYKKIKKEEWGNLISFNV